MSRARGGQLPQPPDPVGPGGRREGARRVDRARPVRVLVCATVLIASMTGCATAMPTGTGPAAGVPSGQIATAGLPSTAEVLAIAGAVVAGHQSQLDRLGAEVTSPARVVSDPVGRPDGTVVVRVSWGYRIGGFDTVDRTVPTELTLARAGGPEPARNTDTIGSGEPAGTAVPSTSITAGTWHLVHQDDTIDRVPLYALTGLISVQSAGVLVVGTVDAGRLTAIRDDALAARAQVAQWWTPVPPVVVVVPATHDEAVSLMARGSGMTGDVAAITDGPIPAGADSVILDPDGFGQLTDVGRAVVLTHEISHVAVRRSCPGGCIGVPVWLREGYADLVGFSAAPPGQNDRHSIAATLLARLRSGTWTPRLPTDADFAADPATVDSAYLASWLLLARLDDRFGADAVRRFYLSAAQVGTDRAFEQVLGTTGQAVVADWSDYVRSLS